MATIVETAGIPLPDFCLCGCGLVPTEGKHFVNTHDSRLYRSIFEGIAHRSVYEHIRRIDPYVE